MAKYTQDEINALGAKGHAFKNPDGHYSYPVGDEEDLDNAIRAVGRGGADHDAIRKYITGRAQAMGKSSKIPANWGADGSLAESKNAARAVFELRKRRRGSMIRVLERRRMPFARGNVQLRAKPDGTGGSVYEFEGYGAVFDAPFDMWDPWGDPYVEIVRPEAFTQTLASNPDVPFLVGHNDAGIPLARTRSGTMTLSQDSRGLHVLAQMDGRSSQARDLAVAVERGDLDEMSIGFITLPGGHRWSEDWMQREMLNLDLHRGDVSAVALAANPATSGATMAVLSSGRPAERRRPKQQRMPTEPYTVHGGEAYPCPQCGSVNDDDASFCDQCGAKMPVGPRGPAVAEMGSDHTQQCQGCLSMNGTDAKYCDQCGSELAGIRPWRTAGGGYTWDDDWASRNPGRERRDDAAGEVANDSDAPDYNPGAQVEGDGTHPPMTCTHSHAHPAYGADDSPDGMMHTHEHSHRGDAQHAPVAAASGLHDHQYNSDGTIVLDDAGVVEEVGGAMADADLLSRRLRLLELA